VGLAVSAVKKAATGSHIGMGGVTFEGEVIDSQSGEILGAVIDSKTGKNIKLVKVRPSGGMSSMYLTRGDRAFGRGWTTSLAANNCLSALPAFGPKEVYYASNNQSDGDVADIDADHYGRLGGRQRSASGSCLLVAGLASWFALASFPNNLLKT